MAHAVSRPAKEDPMDAGIRELVKGIQQDHMHDLRKEMDAKVQEVAGMGPERFKELSQRVDGMERAVSAVRADVAKWLEEVREAKRAGEEAAGLRKRVEEAGKHGAERSEEMRKEVASLREVVAASERQQKELLHQSADEVRQLKERTQALAKLESELGKLKAEELRREVEALKAKVQWLEGQARKGERGLEERLEELEALVARLKGTSPVVLE